MFVFLVKYVPLRFVRSGRHLPCRREGQWGSALCPGPGCWQQQDLRGLNAQGPSSSSPCISPEGRQCPPAPVTVPMGVALAVFHPTLRVPVPSFLSSAVRAGRSTVSASLGFPLPASAAQALPVHLGCLTLAPVSGPLLSEHCPPGHCGQATGRAH